MKNAKKEVVNKKNVAKNIKALRRQRGLTQAEVAEKTGVTTAHISHIEIGKGTISLPLLIEMCKVMRVTPNDILVGEFSTPNSGSKPSDGQHSQTLSVKNINPSDRMLLNNMYEFMKKRKRRS